MKWKAGGLDGHLLNNLVGRTKIEVQCVCPTQLVSMGYVSVSENKLGVVFQYWGSFECSESFVTRDRDILTYYKEQVVLQ